MPSEPTSSPVIFDDRPATAELLLEGDCKGAVCPEMRRLRGDVCGIVSLFMLDEVEVRLSMEEAPCANEVSAECSSVLSAVRLDILQAVTMAGIRLVGIRKTRRMEKHWVKLDFACSG